MDTGLEDEELVDTEATNTRKLTLVRTKSTGMGMSGALES